MLFEKELFEISKKTDAEIMINSEFVETLTDGERVHLFLCFDDLRNRKPEVFTAFYNVEPNVLDEEY